MTEIKKARTEAIASTEGMDRVTTTESSAEKKNVTFPPLCRNCKSREHPDKDIFTGEPVTFYCSLMGEAMREKVPVLSCAHFQKDNAAILDALKKVRDLTRESIAEDEA